MIILLKRGEETITFPCGSYGNIGNPTLEMLLEMGFVVVTPPPRVEPFDDLKQRKKQEISAGFDNTLVSKLTSYTTTGLVNNITINARERDLYNIEQLRNHMLDNSIPSANFRCFDNTFAITTISDVIQVEKELRAFGLFLYQQKWLLESLIESTTKDTPQNRDDIEGLTWAF